MTISILTAPKSTQLTLLATVKTELGVSGSADDALINTLIDQASSMIETYAHRPFYRAQFSEQLASSKTTRMVLSRLPVLQLDAITYDGGAETVADYAIENAESGFVYLSTGFSTTGSPVEWVFSYRAGYLLPGDDVASTAVNVSSVDDSYNDVATTPTIPANLVAGDKITVAGYTNTANNGIKTVVSATSTKIIVEETLITEAEGNAITMAVRNLPEVIERIALDLTKMSYQTRKQNSSLSSLKVGPVEQKLKTADAPVKNILLGLTPYRVHMQG
jgi:hypothetical protein